MAHEGEQFIQTVITREALALVNAAELEAIGAHELAHEYFWDDYDAALKGQAYERLQAGAKMRRRRCHDAPGTRQRPRAPRARRGEDCAPQRVDQRHFDHPAASLA